MPFNLLFLILFLRLLGFHRTFLVNSSLFDYFLLFEAVLLWFWRILKHIKEVLNIWWGGFHNIQIFNWTFTIFWRFKLLGLVFLIIMLEIWNTLFGKVPWQFEDFIFFVRCLLACLLFFINNFFNRNSSWKFFIINWLFQNWGFFYSRLFISSVFLEIQDRKFAFRSIFPYILKFLFNIF